MSSGCVVSDAGWQPMSMINVHPDIEVHTWHHEVRALQRLVTAHKDVEVEVGLRENGHMWVLRVRAADVWHGGRAHARCGRRTWLTILRSIMSRMGMCRPNSCRCICSLRLSCVASHYPSANSVSSTEIESPDVRIRTFSRRLLTVLVDVTSAARLLGPYLSVS